MSYTHGFIKKKKCKCNRLFLIYNIYITTLKIWFSKELKQLINKVNRSFTWLYIIRLIRCALQYYYDIK